MSRNALFIWVSSLFCKSDRVFILKQVGSSQIIDIMWCTSIYVTTICFFANHRSGRTCLLVRLNLWTVQFRIIHKKPKCHALREIRKVNKRIFIYKRWSVYMNYVFQLQFLWPKPTARAWHGNSASSMIYDSVWRSTPTYSCFRCRICETICSRTCDRNGKRTLVLFSAKIASCNSAWAVQKPRR